MHNITKSNYIIKTKLYYKIKLHNEGNKIDRFRENNFCLDIRKERFY